VQSLPLSSVLSLSFSNPPVSFVLLSLVAEVGISVPMRFIQRDGVEVGRGKRGGGKGEEREGGRGEKRGEGIGKRRRERAGGKEKERGRGREERRERENRREREREREREAILSD